MVEDVQIETAGPWGIVTLTRQAALNALTLEMCEAIDTALARWARDPDIKAVLVEGAGEKAFCAGGDIRWLAGHGPGGASEASRFFRAEYRMNARIHAFPKPFVALMDGICMGGGVGLSHQASHRIVTERTMWAMPECGIGLIPDVGATYLLPRLAGGLGPWLGLTGARLTGPGCLGSGLATHYLSADRLVALRGALLGLPLADEASASIDAALVGYCEHPEDPAAPQRADIDRLFTNIESLPTLLIELDGEGTDLAAAALKSIRRASPTSLVLTLESLRSAPAGFNDCLAREFNVVFHLMANHDFHEGVRAQVIDKDRNPTWQPATLDDVTQAQLAEYYRVPQDGGLDLSAVE